MSSPYRKASVPALALALAAGLLWSAEAAAQAAPAAPDPAVSGLTVMAPKIVERTGFGMYFANVGVSVRVHVGDLDINSPAGKTEFDRRVGEAADYVCEVLFTKYPDDRPDQRGCVRDALEGVDHQVAAFHAKTAG